MFKPFFRGAKGEKNVNAKVTNEQAKEIRELYAAGGLSQTKLAQMFGLTQGNISMIIQGKAYKS